MKTRQHCIKIVRVLEDSWCFGKLLKVRLCWKLKACSFPSLIIKCFHFNVTAMLITVPLRTNLIRTGSFRNNYGPWLTTGCTSFSLACGDIQDYIDGQRHIESPGGKVRNWDAEEPLIGNISYNCSFLRWKSWGYLRGNKRNITTPWRIFYTSDHSH